ncbi:DEAD/DEAH box helicase [Actinomycetospora sp. NBRC 106378]|uniref:DEAD/DEAH box helicase n=1 Tax=Actinomycetospora sp. NBRC 106378 TaxID=3032208 RepID=UPI0024A34F88|nr:DEAD/DEAH box helicase [Actinomycetospora sp. NBRC 106378]GLZ51337.1 ATP-dependent helicase [Actinomycetospora sp. NBRC 106378]
MSSSPADRLNPVLQHHIVNTLGWPGLRPLQEAAVGPVLDGVDALLLAPTAGGKTEAAAFPVLSRMTGEGWAGVSVLYVCPLRALLSNLQPRLASYAAWLGRTAALWHGDTSATARAAIRRDRPDVLLTTPESLESMLVSTSLDAHRFFADLQAVVVDEVHAFAGDDRGSHLLAVLERLEVLASRPLQRIGLSATVGNPAELLAWLQGPHVTRRRDVVAVSGPPPVSDVTLDHVGSVEGAAKVISTLHRGEKRLVFVDSRRRAEELGNALRAREVSTFLSHSSLSAAERRRSEEAFAEARDCVIVATSTLELGIDVGDLDRVIQLGAPRTVASFLQRLGRTGRRADSVRNCLFLGLGLDEVLHAAGLLHRWATDWVEPISAPPLPRHIAAQQLLALALQEGALGRRTWHDWWSGLSVLDDGAEVLAFLEDGGFLEPDGDLLAIGPEAERRFGRRHFMELLAVFTAPPEFTVLHGRAEVGMVGDDVLVADTGGAPRVLLLGGRTWLVIHVDWKRRRCWVEPTDLPGRARWSGTGGGLSFEITRGMRDVLLGANPAGVTMSRRALAALNELRAHHSGDVAAGSTILRSSPDGDLHWWTWAGTAANRTLAASLPSLVDPAQRFGDQVVRLRHGLDPRKAAEALRAAGDVDLVAPPVNDQAVRGLKFSAALPVEMARRTVSERLVDRSGARAVLGETRSIAHD